MSLRRPLLLALAAVLATPSMPSASVKTKTAAVPQSAESARAQSQTVRDMRVLGTALFAWLTDHFDADNDAPLEAPAEGKPCVSMKAKTGPCEIVDVEKLPLISHEELTRSWFPITSPRSRKGTGGETPSRSGSTASISTTGA